MNLYQDRVENVSWLLITNGVVYDFKVVFSVPITAKAGDIIGVTFRTEVTNQQVYNVGTGSYILLGNSSTDTIMSPSKCILRPAGENVTPAMHHQLIAGSCGHPFAEDFTGFVNVVIYAVTNSPSAGPGATLTVEQNYGQLDVFHYPLV